MLLLGKNGQLGWELQRTFGPLGEPIALDRRKENVSDPFSSRHLEDRFVQTFKCGNARPDPKRLRDPFSHLYRKLRQAGTGRAMRLPLVRYRRPYQFASRLRHCRTLRSKVSLVTGELPRASCRCGGGTHPLNAQCKTSHLEDRFVQTFKCGNARPDPKRLLGIRRRFDPDRHPAGLAVKIHILDMPRRPQPKKPFVKVYISHD
jgi:hypothetical protein